MCLVSVIVPLFIVCDMRDIVMLIHLYINHLHYIIHESLRIKYAMISLTNDFHIKSVNLKISDIQTIWSVSELTLNLVSNTTYTFFIFAIQIGIRSIFVHFFYQMYKNLLDGAQPRPRIAINMPSILIKSTF